MYTKTYYDMLMSSHPLFNGQQSYRRRFLISRLAGMQPTLNQIIFDRRTEVLLWHPFHRWTLLAGSHGGDIVMYEKLHVIPYVSSNCRLIRKGKGKGGSICDMAFDNNDTTIMFLCSHDSTFTKYDIEIGENIVMLDTGDVDHWFTSLCQSSAVNCLMASDNRGYVHTLDPRSVTTSIHCNPTDDPSAWPGVRLHKSNKISHIAMHSEGFVFCTASNDKSVRLFDIRKIERDHAMAVLPHTGVVSNAVFSPHSNSTLLTTSQNDEIRVYDVNCMHNGFPRMTIKHPHKHYQHLTVIRASWHPLVEDVVLVGRYGEDGKRGIDVFDVSRDVAPKDGSFRRIRDESLLHTPALTTTAVSSADTESSRDLSTPICRLEGGFSTICCLNELNQDASCMATATANNVVIWHTKDSSDSDGEDSPSLGRSQTVSSAAPRPGPSRALKNGDDQSHHPRKPTKTNRAKSSHTTATSSKILSSDAGKAGSTGSTTRSGRGAGAGRASESAKGRVVAVLQAQKDVFAAANNDVKSTDETAEIGRGTRKRGRTADTVPPHRIEGDIGEPEGRVVGDEEAQEVVLSSHAHAHAHATSSSRSQSANTGRGSGSSSSRTLKTQPRNSSHENTLTNESSDGNKSIFDKFKCLDD